jgi:DNA-binding MarR family transcriptional regulator
MPEVADPLAAALFSELFSADQLARTRLTKVLPKGMELSHFSVLNHLAHLKDERTPAQLAKSFNVTRGAMTNTLNKLEWAGYIHIRPDWEDARSKQVAISPAGQRARHADYRRGRKRRRRREGARRYSRAKRAARTSGRGSLAALDAGRHIVDRKVAV